jgi:hypothetical protein
MGGIVAQLSRLGFWVKAAWALIRGRRAMESLIVRQAEKWMDEYLHLR